jgi:hypothetical protein
MRPFKITLLLAVLATVLGALVPAATATTRTPYRVSAFVASTDVVGEGLLVHGRVRPKAPRTLVSIQARRPGSATWTTVRQTRVRADGTYGANVTLNQAGAWRIRVLKPAGAGHRRGVSGVHVVNAWAWRSLETMFLDVVQDSGTTVQSSYTLGAQTFKPAYLQGDQGDRFFALNGRCKQLDVWVFSDPTSANDDDTAALVLGSRAADSGSYGDNLAHPLVH